ncbi:MAG: hypothetical protein ABFE07_28990 [Armatimonadia bacterium]
MSKQKQYVLVWVEQGIIQQVQGPFDDPEIGMHLGKQIAQDFGYDEGADCIDVFELGGSGVAYWQYRDKEEENVQ